MDPGIEDGLEDSTQPRACVLPGGPEHLSRVLEIGRRIDTRAWRLVCQVHGDPVAMPQRAQLLQTFELFQGRRLQGWKLPQEARPIAVDTHMTQWPRQLAAALQPPVGRGHITAKRNRRA